MTIRTFYDPLHRGIKLDSTIPEEGMVLQLIDSSPFQRLRRIKQLGPASLTFHGAESSRFTHSLGVFHIARRALDKLIAFNPKLINYRGLLYGAALLHDIGHGPLSHTSEEMFGIKHEEWSAKLIRNHIDISKILNQLEHGLAEKVASLIEGKDNSERVIKTLVSSQLDCDRLDYLMRDSYSSGATYGQLDLERILSALTLAPDGDLAIQPKGILAVEHYLIVRNLMYKSIYNHRLNEVCNWQLEQIISIAKSLGPNKVWADCILKKWIWDKPEITIEDFLRNDDVLTGYHLIRWSQEAPEPLGSLCKNFLNRALLKATNIEDLSTENQLEALVMTRRLSENIGKDSNLNCGLRHNKIYGYYPYKSGLRIWDGEKLQALEDVSSLVEKLITPCKAAWLIYPKEVEGDLKKELIKIRSNY